MFKIIIKIVVFLCFSVGLYAGNGLSQKHLVSVSPEVSEVGVLDNAVVEVIFDTPIKTKSVKKHTIVLKHNKHKVKGTTTLVGESTLLFTSKESLEEGSYKVIVKKVKLQKEKSEENTMREPKTDYEKFIYWLCSLLYDNPADCSLCKYVYGGNGNDTVKTKKIRYDFTVDETSPKIETITLNKTGIEIHEGNETTLSVTANYDDNTTQDISNSVVWSVQDSSIASVINGTLKGFKEGNTTIEAMYDGKTSDSLNLTVYREINGYKLPPEPDETQNNATLLGIDINDNGVRDDVERKIIIKYVKPIEIEVMIAFAKIDQEILANPLSQALLLERKASKVGDCKIFLRRQGIKIKRAIKYSEDFTYNTKERAKKYIEYNKALSGGVYGSSPLNYKAESCDFDVEQMLKDRK